jgi:hypothetical protein
MPEDSFVRFEGQDISKYLPLLEQIYRFESERISGSHGGGRRHTTLRWTKEELTTMMETNLPGFSTTDLTNLLEILVAENHMMTYTNNDATYFASRVGELVRNITCLHEFQERDSIHENSESGDDEVIPIRYSIMDGIRWEPRLRYGPAREISPDKVIEDLESRFPSDYELPNEVSIADAISDLRLVMQAYDRKFSGNLQLSEFQANSIITELLRSWKGYDNPMVLTAGTGMGKTIAFAIPVLTEALIQNRNGQRVCSQLLLYPRNDLAKDQFTEIQSVIKHLNFILIKSSQHARVIGIAIDADGLIKQRHDNYPVTGGETVTWGVGGQNVFKSSAEIYSGPRPAAIVACSIESFRRRLRIKSVIKGLSKGLQRIVSDEVHLCSGTQGAHVSIILNRIKQLTSFSSQNNLTFIGVSATIAKPRKHVAKIWFGKESKEQDVTHVDALSAQHEEPMGILHHILVKDRQHASTIGSLVDLTSAVVHHRRIKTMERPEKGQGYDFEQLQKTVCFADSHEIVGNWYSYMLDNEVTTAAARMESHDTDMRLPYNQWHNSPLSCHEGGAVVCASCQAGKYHPEPITVSKDKIGIIQTTRFPSPPGEEERFELRFLDSPSFILNDEGDYLISGLDTCPHSENGTCWRFAPRTGDLENRPGGLLNGLSFKESARVKRHTSKTQDGDDGNEIRSADRSFEEKAYKGAYPAYTPRGGEATADWTKKIPHDIAIATPTLEVGVDMNNVTEVMTHKAIRNVSSYRQKVGRAGRERGTDALAVTLISASGQDFHHYRSIRNLIDANISDPVPLASGNRIVLSSEAYDAVFDYLTQGEFPNIELIGNEVSTSLEENIKTCMTEIYDETTHESIPQCFDYVKQSVRSELEYSKIHEAIRAVWQHLKKLLTIVGVSVNSEQISGIRFIAMANNNQKPPKIDPNKEKWKQLERGIPVFSSLGIIKTEDIELLKEIILHKNVARLKQLDEKYPELPLSDQFQDAPPQDPFAAELEVITRDPEKHKGYTWYLSTLIRAIPSMKWTSPYISPETLFINPHEAPVEVRKRGKNNSLISEFIPGAEALIFALPGMWTHRLFTGDRYYVSSGKDAIILPNTPSGKFLMRMDSEIERGNPPKLSSQGVLSEVEQKNIPPILDVEVESGMPTVRIDQLSVQRDNGKYGRPNTVGFPNREPFNKALVGNMDIVELRPFVDKKRPNSYSITWVTAEPGDASECTTYKITGTTAGSSSESQVSVRNHPLLNVMFSNIQYHNKMKIRRFALGVARSNNVVLIPFENGKNLAFVDEFTAPGFTFNVDSEFLNSGRDDLIGLTSEFSEATLQLIGHWLLSTKVFKDSGVDSFLVKAYLDALTDFIWSESFGTKDSNAFPENIEHFLRLWLKSGKTIDRKRMRSRFEQDRVADDLLGEFLDRIDALIMQIGIESDYIIQAWGEISSHWYRTTVANTLGLLLAESVGEFAGVQSNSVSYTYEINKETHDVKILVFDNEPEGNGACDLARKYFHLPISIKDIANSFGDTFLPSSSLVDIIERKCSICEEHIIHNAAISNSIPENLEPSTNKEAKELQERYRSIWNNNQITSVTQAALHFRRRFALSGAEIGEKLTQENRTKMLETELALDVCGHSCPACRGDGSINAFPVHLSEYVTNRACLDAAIGDWSEHEGYLKSITDREIIQQESGRSVPSNLKWHVIKNSLPPKELIRNAVKYPSPPVGYSIIRNQTLPQEIEFNIRTMDVL